LNQTRGASVNRGTEKTRASSRRCAVLARILGVAARSSQCANCLTERASRPDQEAVEEYEKALRATGARGLTTARPAARRSPPSTGPAPAPSAGVVKAPRGARAAQVARSREDLNRTLILIRLQRMAGL
jgi:hypothetical protein